jgi:ribosome-associated protein
LVKLVKKPTDTNESDFLPNTRRIASLAADYKAADIRAYDVRELTPIADSFVVCTAASEPQVKAVFRSVKAGMKEIGVAPLHAEGTSNSSWLLLDYGAIIFHVFREEARDFYDLDGLWGDAPAIDLGLDEEERS